MSILVQIKDGVTHVDMGSKEFRPGEMAMDMVRTINAMVLMMERTTEFDENKTYVRARQLEALEMCKEFILAVEGPIEQDLTTKEKQAARRTAREFMARFRMVTEEVGKHAN